MYMTMMQHRLLTCKNKNVILANGRCSGQTYALILKALTAEGYHVSFYVHNHKEREFVYRKIYHILQQECTNFKAYPTQFKFILDSGVIIYLLTPEDEVMVKCNIFTRKVEKRMILVDQVDFFPKYWVDYILQVGDYHQKVFTTQPIHCGWIKPKFSHGLPWFNIDGNLVVEDTSWDYKLIDWNKTKSTRASVDDYLENVTVITGYGAEDALLGGKLDYLKYIEGLSPMEKLLVQSNFIKGISLEEEK